MLLADESESTCSHIIRSLSKKYNSVAFQPHLTLAGTPRWPEEKLRDVIDEIIEEVTPFELITQKVLCKPTPYQKITFGIRESPVLNYLHQKTDALFEGDYSKKDYPHISFLYSKIPCKNIDPEELDEIKRGTPKQVAFNRIALVHCKGTPEEWRMLYMCALHS